MPAANSPNPFRDQSQKASVCRALCETVALHGVWSAAGPTETAREHLGRIPEAWSPGQAMYFAVAWDIWDGSSPPFASPVTLNSLLEIVSGKYLRILGELVMAVAAGGPSIDQWLQRYDIGPMPRN